MPNDESIDWDEVVSSAARLQKILPDAVLVGGTASALYAKHRYSHDADHVLTDLRERFDEVLAKLESVAGWSTARVKRPVLILGSLDGVETGVRQLMRQAPLETTRLAWAGQLLTVPTIAEILRIKAVLILRRNATRDYVDFAALADGMGDTAVVNALRSFDQLYPQPNAESALQQLQIQLASPVPYDLEAGSLAEYRNLNTKWRNWSAVEAVCSRIAELIFDRITGVPGG